MTLEYETNQQIRRQLRILGYHYPSVEWDGALAAARVHADRLGLGALTIEAAAEAVRATRQRLADMLTASCPGPHRFAQHRDHRPPWCRACRYTTQGQPVQPRETSGGTPA